MEVLDGSALRDILYHAQNALQHRAAKAVKDGDYKTANQLIRALEMLERIDYRAAEVAAVLA